MASAKSLPDGKTIAEVAGIKVDATNRWVSLIDSAIKWKTKTGGFIVSSTEVRRMVRVTH